MGIVFVDARKGSNAGNRWSRATGCLGMLVVWASFVGCSGDAPAEQTTPTARQLKVLTRTFAAAGPPELRERFTGIVVPHRSSALAAKALGRVEQVMVDMGDRVETGQLLIQLDEQQLNAELQVAEANLAGAKNRLDELQTGPRRQDIDRAVSRVAEVQANLQLAQANFERAQELRISGAISRQEFDERQFAVQALESQLGAAAQELDLLREGTRQELLAAQVNAVLSLEAEIERIRVRVREQQVIAPYAGQVQARLIDEGDVVQPGQTLLQLVESAELEVEVGLPVQLANNLQPSRVDLVVGGDSDTGGAGIKLPAELARMAPGLDAATRTRKCVFKLRPSAGEHVVIGDAVHVFVRLPLEPSVGGSVWVPTSALSAGPRGLWNLFVVVAHDAAAVSGTEPAPPAVKAAEMPHRAATARPVSQGSLGVMSVVEQRPVELLRVFGEWSEVRGPIDPSESFVIDGMHRIVSGQVVMAVEVTEQSPGEPQC